MLSTKVPLLLRSLLGRLVRIAIASGVTYQAFDRLLRQTYFEVASEFEPLRDKPNSDSRISVLTGLPRREVRALRDAKPEQSRVAPSLEWQVLSAWTSRLDLLDAEGNLRPLPRTQRRGGEQSFDALVASVGSDVRARTVLDEWLRKGYARLDENDCVVLTPRSLLRGTEGQEGAGRLLAHFTGDLLTGFERHYLQDRSGPDFTFHVVYGHGLTEASALTLYHAAYDESMQLLNRLNRLVVEHEALDVGKADATQRITLGFGGYRVEQARDTGLVQERED
ncbi:DUF6502 family protein [Pseudomonas oryzihabitans]|uniref:Uncharacterized protein n=1 Tax=Pseudomonas oryzihabitans TaxID=47885 RepID=A0AAJ2BPJ9_9PSED|nr:DUF6502 family protein [Pseudomonas psychrotolerans]MDR6235131.1 hypothetical protein [Pseudomonas psychrotolerans]MDR6355654.1 hypothetical protein [Pseudomonas psychrotolerans]QDD89838.1 hypothetical protein CCZ28_12750 [Pseudomonas psychrotolerans]